MKRTHNGVGCEAGNHLFVYPKSKNISDIPNWWPCLCGKEKRGDTNKTMLDPATPITDEAFLGDLSVGLQPTITTWDETIDICRRLERKCKTTLDTATLEAVRNWWRSLPCSYNGLKAADEAMESPEKLRAAVEKQQEK